MDQYTKETIQRYESDLKRLEKLEEKIKELQNEGGRLANRLIAYERILKDSIGNEEFKEFHQKLKSAANLPSDSDPETNADDLSTTDIILKVIGKSGSKGMTAAQVFGEVQSFGIGIEKRNTIYGTLSRLNTSNRIKKVGKRYFSIQD